MQDKWRPLTAGVENTIRTFSSKDGNAKEDVQY